MSGTHKIQQIVLITKNSQQNAVPNEDSKFRFIILGTDQFDISFEVENHSEVMIDLALI